MLHPFDRHLGAAVAPAFAAILLLAAAAEAQPTAIGLSTVRAQRFGNDNLNDIFTPQTGDRFGWSFAAGDFNGDGADDLATGMPFDDGFASSPVADSGSVVIRYSTLGDGLTNNPSQVYVRQLSGIEPSEAGDLFGYALAACDFDADGKDDLAVGVPLENYGGHYDAGVVQVHYAANRTTAQLFAQSSPGIAGDVEEGDAFGHSLACGDFDADGFADLAIGVPLEDDTCFTCTNFASYGMVVVIPGSAGGLDATRSRHFDQDVEGMDGGAESGDTFGWSLAVGDFDGDSFDDLAIGVPGEDDTEGQLQVVFGGPGGLTPDGNVFWSETFIGGLSEEGDYFAETLAAADFDGDGLDDLAIGIPLESFSTGADCGQVNVLYGAAAGGFDRGRVQFWADENIYGAGTSEAGDNFGRALAAGDFDKDGFADLAVGAPGELVSGPKDGALTILMGTAAGLSAARHRSIAAGYEGFPGNVLEHDKGYASALATGDFDGDGHADLAIGVLNENDPGNGTADVGSETILYGALFADGVENGNTSLWSQTKSTLYFNKIEVSAAAKLGPLTSKNGLRVSLVSPTLQRPAASVYVRVGPEAGFNSERSLKGTFFVDPQSLTMSPNPGANVFSMLTLTDGVGSGSRTRLTFDLNRNDSVGGWALLATYFDDNAQVTRFAGGAGFALLNNQNDRNNRIDFEWTGGAVGHLTVWKTRYFNGAPDVNGRQLLFSVDLPGMQNAVINHAFAGMVAGQDAGTFGSLSLDELGFRR